MVDQPSVPSGEPQATTPDFARANRAVYELLGGCLGSDEEAVRLAEYLRDTLSRCEAALRAPREPAQEPLLSELQDALRLLRDPCDNPEAVGNRLVGLLKVAARLAWPPLGETPQQEAAGNPDCDECGGRGWSVGPTCCGKRNPETGDCCGSPDPEQIECAKCDGHGIAPPVSGLGETPQPDFTAALEAASGLFRCSYASDHHDALRLTEVVRDTLRAAKSALREAREGCQTDAQLPGMAIDKYRCYHCGEAFAGDEARDHFGDSAVRKARCIREAWDSRDVSGLGETPPPPHRGEYISDPLNPEYMQGVPGPPPPAGNPELERAMQLLNAALDPHCKRCGIFCMTEEMRRVCPACFAVARGSAPLVQGEDPDVTRLHSLAKQFLRASERWTGDDVEAARADAALFERLAARLSGLPSQHPEGDPELRRTLDIASACRGLGSPAPSPDTKRLDFLEGEGVLTTLINSTDTFRTITNLPSPYTLRAATDAAMQRIRNADSA